MNIYLELPVILENKNKGFLFKLLIKSIMKYIIIFVFLLKFFEVKDLMQVA